MTPEEAKKEKKRREIAALPGNAPHYSFDLIPKIQNSPLDGKKLCVLGSSVVFGSASEGYAVGEYLAARFGCELTREAVSGTTLANVGENSYIPRMERSIPTDTAFDLFICQLSTNDARLGMPLGKLADGTDPDTFDTATVTGAIEYIIAYARRTWNCPVFFFTGSRYDNEKYAAMVARLVEIREKWGIGVLDLWHDDDFNSLPDLAGLRSLYMKDKIHPTRAGYRDWWGPEMERQLTVQLKKIK